MDTRQIKTTVISGLVVAILMALLNWVVSVSKAEAELDNAVQAITLMHGDIRELKADTNEVRSDVAVIKNELKWLETKLKDTKKEP